MANAVEFELDDAEVRRRMVVLAAGIKPAMEKAVRTPAERIMTESKERYCPVDTGSLRASGHVEQPVVGVHDVRVRLAYGGPAASYAEHVHNDPNASHTVGEWRYLATPLEKNRPAAVKEMTDILTDEITRLLR